MKFLTLFLGLIFILPPTHGKTTLTSIPVLNFQLEWYMKETQNAMIQVEIQKILTNYQDNLDPDCRYVKPKSGVCNPHLNPQIQEEIEKLSRTFRNETIGSFESQVVKLDGKEKDYYGFAKGYLLEVLNKKLHLKWLAHIHRDYYLSEGVTPPEPIWFSSPRDPRLNWATVEMKSGWIMNTYGYSITHKIRDPLTGGKPRKEDFKKITLFAKSDFNGARLDAWSTALAAAGLPLLHKLEKLKEYNNQWAYIYFDEDFNPTCSKNIECKFDFDNKRQIILPW